ncbi:MAG: EamA family transporter [Chloroflexi bacterium]|nr:EamA family transporter [Chloroflexota bacterium]
MIAVVGGAVAAACWAVATIVSSRSSRMIGASSVLAWVMVVGMVAAAGPAVIVRPTSDLHPAAIVLAVVAGFAYVIGLYLNYRALRIGPVGIAAPIASTEGALAAVIAVALGETLTTAAAVTLVVIVSGVALASMAPGARASEPSAARLDHVRSTRTTAAFASAAALAFAIGLVASARSVTLGMPVVWVALIARCVGVAFVAAPLIASGRIRLVRRAVPLVVIAGVGEVIGSSAYTIGAQAGIATTAIVASQFAPLAAVGAYLLFGERLGRLQVVGVALVVVGVAVLTALTA